MMCFFFIHSIQNATDNAVSTSVNASVDSIIHSQTSDTLSTISDQSSINNIQINNQQQASQQETSINNINNTLTYQETDDEIEYSQSPSEVKYIILVISFINNQCFFCFFFFFLLFSF